MPTSTTARWLSEAIGQATKSAKFCVAGSLPVGPGLEVEGVGAVKLPLKPGMAKKLIARGRVAPYGKGTQTLVDTTVRKTHELDPQQFRLSQEWEAAVTAAAQHAAGQLGLPADQVEARLYKLLVYEQGGFFLPHRDSEKHDGMVASLIVVLPNPFEGGALVVRHGPATQTLRFEQAARGEAPCYAAFYADCEHEVQRVTHGVRLCLAYNLVLKPKGGKQVPAGKPPAGVDLVAQGIQSWVATRPAAPLVFALEHHYTQHGLSLDLLKGADRRLAELVVPAAGKADCLVHLAQVARHLSQDATDGSYGGRYYRHYKKNVSVDDLEIGETLEDALNGSEWTDLHGKKQSWGPITLEPAAIVSSIPLDEWEPTSEEYEGYTGNAGNTLDRWYHRSAIVLWHRDHHFEVITRSGVAGCIPLFRSLVAKLAKTPKKRLEQARADCLRFARAIIGRWPRTHYSSWAGASREPSPLKDFPNLLLRLRDRDIVAEFLSELAERDPTLPLEGFIVAACREFGWNAFASELKKLIAPVPSKQALYPISERRDVLPRDLEWLADFCLDQTEDPDKSTLAHELCSLAVQRFCVPSPPQPAYSRPSGRSEPSVAELTLTLLLKALVAAGEDENLSRVLQFVESSPEAFSLDRCQVPSLKELVPWSQKHFGSVHPRLLAWLASVRQRLETATATPPAPPADWARPAEVDCKCQYCAQLKTFLADPASAVGRITAPEDVRQHLVNTIQRHGCDVQCTLERMRRPYSLVLTKTTGSFDRAARRFEANGLLLKILDEVSKGVALPKGQETRLRVKSTRTSAKPATRRSR